MSRSSSLGSSSDMVEALQPNGDDGSTSQIPVQKLSNVFDNCVKADNGMKVFLRIRPTAARTSLESTITVESESTIITNAPDNSKRAQYTKLEERKYQFTRVFAQASQQSEVYVHTAAPLLERFLQGENCVLFAYGMTNSGKTFTIQGSDQQPGIFPRLVKDILVRMKSERITDWELKVSMLEIYQEKLIDLLGERKTKLTIRDGNGKVEVGKLTSHAVTSAADAIKLMDTASVQRSKSTTLLNSGSSRSHAVYTLTLNRSSVGRDVIFQVVDLAGAERSSRTKASAQQQKEANNINVSLMQLWRCLQGMKRRGADGAAGSSSSADIIPFRESKLTHLLMPLLTRAGLNGVAMVACVNPQIDDYDETLSILGNASLACKIKEMTDLGRTATQPATAAQQQLSEDQRVQQEIRMHELKLRAAAESAAMGKKRRLEAAAASASVPVPAVKGTKRGSAMAAKSVTLPAESVTDAPPAKVAKSASKNRSTMPQNNRSSELVSASKRTYSSMAAVPTGADVRTATAADESSLAQREDDDDRVTGSEVKRMRYEIEQLREENYYLASEQLSRETEIRVEVSEEMAVRGAHLLDQIQELQEQLNRKESQVADVTRSVKKVRRRQKEQANDDRMVNLAEAEEELGRVKAHYERELAHLRDEKDALEEQLHACQTEVRALDARLVATATSEIGQSSSSSSSSSRCSANVASCETAIAETLTDLQHLQHLVEPPAPEDPVAAPEVAVEMEVEVEVEAQAEVEAEAEVEVEAQAEVEVEPQVEVEVEAQAEVEVEPEVEGEVEAQAGVEVEADVEMQPEAVIIVEVKGEEVVVDVELPPFPPKNSVRTAAITASRKKNAVTNVEAVAELAVTQKTSAAAEFSQRMQRDQRFKGKNLLSSVGPTAAVAPTPEPVVELAREEVAEAIPVSTVESAGEVVVQKADMAEEPKRSPARSPLAPIHANGQASPRNQAPVHAVGKSAASPKPVPSPRHPGHDPLAAKKTTTFAIPHDTENVAPAASTAPVPLKPRARVVSARNVISGRLTNQASDVLAAYQAATLESSSSSSSSSSNANPHAGSYISRLRSRVVHG